MNNDAITAGHKIDHLAHRSGILITGHNQGSRRNPSRITGLVQERPQITGLIFIIQVCRYIYLVHLSPPLPRQRF